MFDSLDDFESDHDWDQAENMAVEAFELYEQGKLQQALERLNIAIETGAEHGEWYFNAALALDGLEQYEKAISFYKRALKCNSDDLEILNCLGVNYTRTAQYDMALKTFEQMESLDPNFEPAYCNRIITYTEMEQHDKAEQMFYMAQQINPDCALCFYNIGNSLFSRGEYERAIWCWDKCAELDSGHPQIHFRLAQACWVSGQGRRARKEFLIEIRKNPADLDVILDFGLFLLESGDLESAKEKFNRILEFDENFALAKFYLAEVYLLQDCFSQAVYWYHLAAQTDPQMAGPRFRLAQICKQGGEFNKGIELLRQELSLGIDDADVLTSMGWMLLEMGNETEASNCFLRVLEEAEGSDRVFFGLGMSLIMSNEYDGGMRCLRHAIHLNPVYADALLCAGWLCYKMKKWSRALWYVMKCQTVSKNRQPYRDQCKKLQKSILWSRMIQKIKVFGFYKAP